MTTESLPTPTGERWTPLRLGLTELYYYDDEQFWFRNGRLLLRGNNGTGKSKVLALTLPFLLDANLSPARVEPDADRHKRMEWNLLLRGTEDYEDRTGYTWLEFGRLDPATDTAEYFTIGCGLKAVNKRGIVRHWFFTTPRRVGDLRLIDHTGTVLTRERLRDEVTADGQGRIFENDTAGYRRAIDDTLFKLGEDRYGTLVDLLIQLRQPQLSVKPNEAKLSDALTNSLPPLPPEVLADLAESFRALDEDKHRLEELEQLRAALRKFLRDHRRYARALTALRAQDVRRTHSVYEDLGRDLAAIRSEEEAARGAIVELEEAASAAQHEIARLEARHTALQDSAAWGEARDLDQARQAAQAAAERAREALAARERALKASADAEAEAGTATERQEQARIARDEAHAVSLAAASQAGLAQDHDRALASREDATRIVRRRAEQADHMALTVKDVQATHVRAEHARDRAADAETDAAGRREMRARADEVVAEATEALLAACETYLACLSVLQVPAPADLLARVDTWAADPESREFPLATHVADLAADQLSRIAGRRARLDIDMEASRQQLAEHRARLAMLEAGTAPTPAQRHTRRDSVESDQARPLFELTDFADDVGPADRAGLEAALEAAGLVDALIRPDGSVREPETGDLLLSTSSGPESPPWPTLDGVLRPDTAAQGDGVPGADTLRGVLRGIGLGEGSGPVWVAASGDFALGSARGAWTKPEAQYIGAAARERQRMAAIAQATRDIAVAEQEIADLTDAIAATDRETERVKAERAMAPDREPQALVEAAHGAYAAVREEMAAAERAAEAAQAASRAHDEAAETKVRADAIGQELGIDPTEQGVARVRAALSAWEAALVEARGAAQRAGELDSAAVAARDRATNRMAEAEERVEAHRRVEGEDLAAGERLATLTETVGASVAELNDELERLARDRAAATAHADGVTKSRLDAANRLGAALATFAQLDLRRSDATSRREEAFERLRRFAGLSLLRIAAPTIEVTALESAAAVVHLARRIGTELAEVATTDDALDEVRRRNSAAVSELRTELGVYSHPVEAVEHSDGEEVRIRYGERDMAADELAVSVEESIDVKSRTLSAREREILENYLMADTAGQLAELMVQAVAWVRNLNREMGVRATSTGMKLRLRWEARSEAPSGLDEVRSLLLRAGAVWNETERGVIGGFLQRAIEAERAADPAAGWDEHLRRAFDYRQWHSFRVERSQGSNWVSGSGPASTGERALTLTLPLFAAAASYYSTAGNPAAPRLILLDEAFAGIDNDARANAMGLFAEFDLDAVMTSEREWGCYPSVPGLAIVHLGRKEGVNAVHVSRWEWDGTGRSASDDPPPEAMSWERADGG
ncbi:MAG: TIGR02680 family protein [Bifidobacteriaceae bacterium]|nr:TIGR02680 family protein [Bifidobacteriaceae bacterium]